MKTEREILDYRKEIEREIVSLLEKVKSDFTLDDVKRIVYEENDQNDLAEIIKMFDTGYGFAELSNILELANDAWNYFPHKMLGGLSPEEKILEHSDKNK